MKDCFGIEITPGTVIAYVTRQGSSTDMYLAMVHEIVIKPDGSEFLRAHTFAGTDHLFSNGAYDYNTHRNVYYNGRNVTLRVPGNIMVHRSSIAEVKQNVQMLQALNREEHNKRMDRYDAERRNK